MRIKLLGLMVLMSAFFKKSWGIIREDVCEAVRDFFKYGHMLKSVNCTAVTLIPKSAQPSSIKEYRPISCCSVLYKIISKVLANRLLLVIDDIVGPSKSAFIPGRLIADNILLSHELVKGYSKKFISPRCMIKVDLQKAYDSVEWSALIQIMKGLGFRQRCELDSYLLANGKLYLLCKWSSN